MHILVIGAGGLATQMLGLFEQPGAASDTLFYVEPGMAAPPDFFGFRVIQSPEALRERLSLYPDFHVAIGLPAVRNSITQRCTALGGRPATIICRHAIISPFAGIGPGCSILAQALVEAGAVLDQGVLLNTGAAVHHHCRIGSFSALGPGARLLGHVQVGSGVTIGASATVLPGISIGDGATIGAGAVVTRQVDAGATVVGVPARSHRI